MGKVRDISGMRFGRLTVEKYAGVKLIGASGKGRAHWICRCECGGIVEVSGNSLATGNTASCGCMHRESLISRNKDGARGVKGHPLYATWTGMLSRCRNPRATDYAIYGGRGIKVCPRWELFENFTGDMGERPDGTTIDRIDTDGDYEPSNCRWATSEQQGRNRRDNRLITVGGKTKCITEWSQATGLNKTVIAQRLNRGWLPADAVTMPTDDRRPLVVRHKGA